MQPAVAVIDLDAHDLHPRESTDETEQTEEQKSRELLYSVPRRPTVRLQQQEPPKPQQNVEHGNPQRRQSRPRLPLPSEDPFVVLRPLEKPVESHYSIIGGPKSSSPLRGKEYAYPQDEINHPTVDGVPSSPLVTPRLANLAAEINRIRLSSFDSDARPRLNTNGSEYAFPQSSVGGSRSGSIASSSFRKYNMTPKSPLKSPSFSPTDSLHYALASRVTEQATAYENARRKISSDSEKYAVPVKRSVTIGSAPRPENVFGYASPQDATANSGAEGEVDNEAVIVQPRVRPIIHCVLLRLIR